MIYISEISTTVPPKGRNATEDKVYQLFTKLGIPFERVDNDVVEAMEECKEVDQAKHIPLQSEKDQLLSGRTSCRQTARHHSSQQEDRCLQVILRIRRSDGEISPRESGLCFYYGTCQ